MRSGSLTVISGFSGAGKGTIMKALLAKYDQYCLSVSVTTRDPRPGEVDGKDYFFISQEEFERMVQEDALLEHAGYVGHSYGTPRAYVEDKIREGRDVLLEIEVQGGQIIKEKVPETIMLFVTTPTPDILVERLKGRGTEDESTIQGRLRQASREVMVIPSYDAVIINDDLDAAVEAVHQTIQAFKRCPQRNTAFLSVFRAGLADKLESMLV